jgi:hypothetical protein
MLSNNDKQILSIKVLTTKLIFSHFQYYSSDADKIEESVLQSGSTGTASVQVNSDMDV